MENPNLDENLRASLKTQFLQPDKIRDKIRKERIRIVTKILHDFNVFGTPFIEICLMPRTYGKVFIRGEDFTNFWQSGTEFSDCGV